MGIWLGQSLVRSLKEMRISHEALGEGVPGRTGSAKALSMGGGPGRRPVGSEAKGGVGGGVSRSEKQPRGQIVESFPSLVKILLVPQMKLGAIAGGRAEGNLF